MFSLIDPFSTQSATPPGKGPGQANASQDPFMTRGASQAQPQEPPSQSFASQSAALMGQPQEPPVLVAPTREPIIPVWYPAQNNWNACIQQMAESFRRINEEFTGQWSTEQRLLKESSFQKAADAMFDKTGGRLGKEYEAKTRTAEVKDIFQDFSFPPSEKSWYRAGDDPPDLSSLPTPANWRRLQEFSMDMPYPSVNPMQGGYVPRAGRVYQGAIEDFYLAVALQTIGMKPQLLASIFVDMNFSNPNLGVFTMRFYKHGQWHHVVVDGALPFDASESPLCCHTEFWPGNAWASLIEKGYAKLHGSWEALGGGGHVEEALTDLTGGCSTRFGTTDVAQDRLWQYLFMMQRFCIFGCNINESEFSRRNIPLQRHWAASIFRVAKYQDIPYVCVCIAAPTFSVRHMPACHVPSPEGYGLHDGMVWLRIDDFVSLFDTIYECRLVNSDLGPPQVTGIPCTPGWVPMSPLFEEMWAFQGDVYTETSPGFLIEVVEPGTEITLEASQTDLRYTDSGEEPEFGRAMQAPILLRFFQCSSEVSDKGGGEIYMVHMSAWGHTRDASLGVKVLRPGKYLAMVSIPGRYVCHRMIFRTYSSAPLAIKPITQHRSWIAVNPGMPLNAIPYSLCGFQRIDAVSEQLPQMFDEASGRGLPLANSQLGSRQPADDNAGSNFSNVAKMFKKAQPMAGMQENPMGLKTVGQFGGRNAIASINAAEVQDENCNLM